MSMTMDFTNGDKNADYVSNTTRTTSLAFGSRERPEKPLISRDQQDSEGTLLIREHCHLSFPFPHTYREEGERRKSKLLSPHSKKANAFKSTTYT